MSRKVYFSLKHLAKTYDPILVFTNTVSLEYTDTPLGELWWYPFPGALTIVIYNCLQSLVWEPVSSWSLLAWVGRALPSHWYIYCFVAISVPVCFCFWNLQRLGCSAAQVFFHSYSMSTLYLDCWATQCFSLEEGSPELPLPLWFLLIAFVIPFRDVQGRMIQ